MTEWRPDVLGADYECIDLDLGKDDEGPLIATLVRCLPEPLSFWQRVRNKKREYEDMDVLYLHGWSDYFFQKPVAEFFRSRGARFFALDLRKYGRSLRAGQTPGYITNLYEYHVEIDLALAKIATSAETPRKLVLFGHSTGGLVLSLWAARNPGKAQALLLNSPWLELQLSGKARKALTPIVSVGAKYLPHESAFPTIDLGFYTQAQKEFATPDEWAQINQDWRPTPSMPVRSAWLKAILDAQTEISAGVDVGAPVCVLLSARSRFGVVWDDSMLYADTVLEVEGVSHAALKLSESVTIQRIDGALHDVFLSEQTVREKAFIALAQWLRGWNAVRSADNSR